MMVFGASRHNESFLSAIIINSLGCNVNAQVVRNERYRHIDEHGELSWLYKIFGHYPVICFAHMLAKFWLRFISNSASA
jgi:hypothetical protein